MHKSLTDLQSLLVLVIENPLHISSWSRVVSCKLTNINNSKFNKVKLVSNVLVLNSSHQTTTETQSQFGLLGSHVHDGKVEWGTSFKVFWNFFFLSKDIRNG